MTNNGSALPPQNGLSSKEIFVGNLTYDTTEQDIIDAIQSIGVGIELINVIFHVNPRNGASMGFCLVSLNSENSSRLCIKRLPDKEMRGRNPVVCYPSLQALKYFEEQYELRTREMPLLPSNDT